jgi:S1-C subfamily serine protease/cytochrome c-type biogenesis protein CcmH/NrfG
MLFLPLLLVLLPDPAAQATVWIRAGDRATGTGWVVDVDRRWILTARHLVGDHQTVDVYFHDTTTARLHYLTDRTGLQKRGRLVTARVIAKRDAADLALLEVESTPKHVSTLRIANASAVAGEPCWSVGHRHDSEFLWTRTTGTVRQCGRLAEGYHWAGQRIGMDVPILLLQSPIEAGESGSAVLSAKGQVIGLVSAVNGRAPGVSIAIDVAEIRTFLADVRGDKPPAPRDSDSEPSKLARATVWVRPEASEGRFGGVLIDRDRRLLLTSAAALSKDDVVDVVAPKWEGKRLVAEAAEYRDLLGLRLSGQCIRGIVLARDSNRDLALVELDKLPDTLAALALASGDLRASEKVVSLTHPTGIELLWLHAAGTVRAVGRVTLSSDAKDNSTKPLAALLQLPHQGGSSGGPIANERGELIGVLASKEGARQELAYAATTSEARAFLETARPLWKPQSAAEWHARAMFFGRRGQMTAAVAAHAEAAKLAPTDAAILASQARTLAEAGSKDLALAAIAKATALPTRSAEVEAVLAQAYFYLGDRSRAAAAAEAALKANPKLVNALVARAALRTGKVALADIEEAIFLDPNCACAYLLRAELRDPAIPDSRELASQDLTRAIELAPNDVIARGKRAVHYEDAKEFKKAVRDWTRLVDIDPLNANHRLSLAKANLLAGDEKAAIISLVAAVRIDAKAHPQVFATIRDRAEWLLTDQPMDLKRALAWYDRALQGVGVWLPKLQRQVVSDVLEATARETDDGKRLDQLNGAVRQLEQGQVKGAHPK